MKYVILDFNGTIVDDLDFCIGCLNQLRKEFFDGLPVDKDTYRHIFTFPISDYYRRAGFDFEKYSYEDVAKRWTQLYRTGCNECEVFAGVREFLKENRLKGNKNIVLSASKIDQLERQLKDLGIDEEFDEILGIDDIYASSKLPIALKFIKGKDPKDCVMIGDTLHDAEVAKQMGVNCVLVAKGHQAKDVLLEAGVEVVEDIREVII